MCNNGSGQINDEGIFTRETSWKFKSRKGYVNLSLCENWHKSYSRSGISCGGVGVTDSLSFKTPISWLLSGTLDEFDAFVKIGSGVCAVGPGNFFACICCSLLHFDLKIVYLHTSVSYLCSSILVLSRILPLIYPNDRSNYLNFFSRLLLIFLYILLEATVVVCC